MTLIEETFKALALPPLESEDDMDLEMFINDLLARMREKGFIGEATTCVNSEGDIISFEIKVVGYED